jgi:hypothetical protein
MLASGQQAQAAQLLDAGQMSPGSRQAVAELAQQARQAAGLTARPLAAAPKGAGQPDQNLNLRIARWQDTPGPQAAATPQRTDERPTP